MHQKYIIANAVLWAAAIIASASFGAPALLSVIVLPTLAVASLLTTTPRLRAVKCQQR